MRPISPHDSFELTQGYVPKLLHCVGVACEDKSDQTTEYCSGDSDTCTCKCESCTQLVKEYEEYEHLGEDPYWDPENWEDE